MTEYTVTIIRTNKIAYKGTNKERAQKKAIQWMKRGMSVCRTQKEIIPTAKI